MPAQKKEETTPYTHRMHDQVNQKTSCFAQEKCLINDECKDKRLSLFTGTMTIRPIKRNKINTPNGGSSTVEIYQWHQNREIKLCRSHCLFI